MEQNHLCNFGRGHHEEHFCEIILNLDQWFGWRCHLKTFLILSSGNPCIKTCETVCAILVEGIMRNYFVKLFWIWTSGSEGNVIKRHFLNRALAALCSVERNHLCNFGRRHHEEQFCDIILNLDQWFRRRCRLKIFLIWSSGSPFVLQSETICVILVKGIMRNFWYYEEQFCEIILN